LAHKETKWSSSELHAEGEPAFHVVADEEDRVAQNAEPWNSTAGVDSSTLAYEEVAEHDGFPMNEEARAAGTDGEEDKKGNAVASEAMSGAGSTKEEQNPAEDLELRPPPSFPRSSC